MIKKLLFILIALISSSSIIGQSNSNQSLLWEISGNGMKAPSYLYGTMHVSSKIAFHLGDTFFQALDQADIIALESDPGKWMEEMFGSKSAMKINGYSKYLNFNRENNFYENLSSADYPDKKSLTAALRDKHALQNGFLYRGSNYENEYEETTYLDLFIYQYGKKNNIKVVNLEDHKETNILQIKAMIPDPELSEEEEKKKNKKKKKYYSKWNKEMTVKEALDDAYRKGHVNVIDSIMKLTSRSDNYMKYFLYERNRIMAHGMDSLMKNHKLFVGIGAAHLAGKEGVIQLLKDKGYNVRPVTRNISKIAKEKKNKIEETFVPIPFVEQTTKDGYLTVKIPGKLYETPGKSGDLQYFYPEMTNGGYFFIRRYSTFSPLHDTSEINWSKKIDSLVFENVEGKILKEKNTTINGFPAKDILNKTRKGDYQRRLIVFTPLEIIFFKMSGTGNWVDIYGDEFFNSITINKQNKQAYTYVSHLKDYEITFPNQPIHNVHAENLSPSPRHIIQSTTPNDSSYYLLFSSKINDSRYIEEDTFEVNYIARTFYEQFDSNEIHSIVTDTISNKSSYGIGTINGDTVYTKVLLKRNFYYLLAAKSSDKKAKDFFNSFHYRDTFPKQEFHHYHDTVLKYSVSTPVHPDDVEDLLYSVRKLRKIRSKKEWNSFRTYRYFSNTATRELVYLSYYKFSDYYHRKNLDVFWEDELSSYQENNLIILQKTIDNNDSIPTCHIIMADTNSTKRIEVKKYLNQGVLFTLKTSYDSISQKTAFIDAFFKTFKPSRDTLIGKPITQTSANLFFDDLASKDSLRVEKAVTLLNNITFEKSDIDSLIWYIDNYEFPDDDEEETKVYLIRELGYIKSPKVMEYLVNYYHNSDEDPEVQFAVLKGLAKLGNKKAYKELTKLLVNNPPIASNNSSVKYLFNYFDDSLQLSNNIYPAVWDLMLYNKYRVPVYKLSKIMLDSGYIKPSSYKKIKPLILRSAKSLAQKKSSSSSRIKLKGTDYYYKNGTRVDYKEFLIDQYSITKYMKLLIPYIKKDKAVEKFFTKIFQSDNNKNRFIATVLFAQNDLTVPDSVTTALSESHTFMYPLYSDLKSAGKLHLFKTVPLNQELMARSVLYAGSSSIDPEEDSITFVKKVKFQEKNNEGYLYFYKSESSYGNKWKLHYVGVMSNDTSAIFDQLDRDFIDRRITVYSEKDIDEKIEEIIEKLYLRNRKRARK